MKIGNGLGVCKTLTDVLQVQLIFILFDKLN